MIPFKKTILLAGCVLSMHLTAWAQPPVDPPTQGAWMVCAAQVTQSPDVWTYNVFTCQHNAADDPTAQPVWLRLSGHDPCSATTCLEAAEQTQLWHTSAVTNNQCTAASGFVLHVGDAPTDFSNVGEVIAACNQTPDGFCACDNLAGAGPEDQPKAQQCRFVAGQRVCT